MEKLVAVRQERSLGRCAAISFVCLAACQLGWAQEVVAAASMQERAMVETRSADQGVRLEVNRSQLPRLDAQDSGFQAPRVDMALSQQGGRGLGVVLGLGNIGLRSATQPNNFSSQPSVDLGLRWRQRVYSNQVDVTAWRRMNNDDDAYSLIQQRTPVYGARVEMHLDSGRSLFNATGGFLGFQLESGAKISVKRKDGRPMVYYRTSF